MSDHAQGSSNKNSDLLDRLVNGDLVDRLQAVVDHLEEENPRPAPYDFYYAVKNEDAPASLRSRDDYGAGDIDRLIDLVERRLLWVRNYAEPVLAQGQSPAAPAGEPDDPEIAGTIVGKVRSLMRALGLGGRTAGQFYSAVERAGLRLDHK